MKPIGWLKFWIIASVVWVIGAWIYTFSSMTNNAFALIVSDQVKCDSDLAGKTGDARRKDFVDCNKQAEQSVVEADKEACFWATIPAIVGLPFWWGFICLVIFLARWVRRGFAVWRPRS
jgi:hypothetical protein